MKILPINDASAAKANSVPFIPLMPAHEMSGRSSLKRLKAMGMLEMAKRSALPPVCFVDFSNQQLKATERALISCVNSFYNTDYGNSYRMLIPGESSIKVAMDFRKNPNRSYFLNLNHLSSLVNGQPLSKITIEVNGQVVEAGYNPNSGNYVFDSFDITKYVVDGTNTVQIRLDSDAGSHYWIQALSIQAK